MSLSSSPSRRLIVPAVGGLYASLSTLSETLLRVAAGGALAIHGSSKIGNPTGAAGMVESIGFYPGEFWSVLLSVTEFFGGILIALGLLTRPAALGGLVILLVTVYFHWIVQGQGYSGAEKSILWAAMLFFIFVRGANAHSVDAKLGREF